MIKEQPVLPKDKIQEAANKYKPVWEINGKQLSKVEILQRQHRRLYEVAKAQRDDTFKQTLKAVYEWGNERCIEHDPTHDPDFAIKRWYCIECRQTLQEEV